MRAAAPQLPTAARARRGARAACARRAPLRVNCYREETAAKASPSKPLAAPQLAKDEARSLAAFCAAHGVSPAALASGAVPAALHDSIAATIARGLQKQEADLHKLEGALLAAERLFYATGGTITDAGPPQAVDVWQPIFASAGGFPRLLYIPVPEFFDLHRSLPEATAISIDSVTGSIDASSSAAAPGAAAAAAPPQHNINIVTELGPLTTHFLGTCSWLTGDTCLRYSITAVRLDVGGRRNVLTIPLSGPLQLNNELQFFMAGLDAAAARSKLGGTMLLAADPPAGARYRTAW